MIAWHGPAAARDPAHIYGPGELTDDYEYVPGEAWKEAEVHIPETFDEDGLIEVEMGIPSSRLKYFLDESSLSIGPDRVVRYILVLESRRGARNLYYEGLRCATAEYRRYAYGGADGRLKEYKRSEWWPISVNLGASSYHRRLLEGLLCDEITRIPLKKDVIVRNLRNSGFHQGYRID
jgi:hypothetical protein